MNRYTSARSAKYRLPSINSLRRSKRFRTPRRKNNYRRPPRSWEGLKKGLAYGFYLFTAITILASVSLLLVVGYQYCLTSPFFCIKDANCIQIQGLERITPAQILQIAQLSPGISLLAIKPLEVEKALNQHPWVKRAELIRQWPDRLTIVIKEHQPIAIVPLDRLYYMNRQGVLFKPLEKTDSHDLPVITGLTSEDFQAAGDQPSPLLKKIVDLIRVLKETPAPLNFKNIAEIHVDPERGLTLYSIALGIGIDIGFQAHKQKFANFRKLLPTLERKGEIQRVVRINLNYPNRVLVSFKKPDQASP
ncbi:MAG: FtsQ-type POTRA domain-containing protein [Deltaproteobacteria bacterium]|nr:FtsQ-type POTRA domain-containing protein [Deltaproteobacteria bacterium]